MVTVVSIKFNIESIVTIDAIVTELKKNYYKTRKNVDFTMLLENIQGRKNKSMSMVTLVSIKFSIESIVTINITATELKK